MCFFELVFDGLDLFAERGVLFDQPLAHVVERFAARLRAGDGRDELGVLVGGDELELLVRVVLEELAEAELDVFLGGVEALEHIFDGVYYGVEVFVDVLFDRLDLLLELLQRLRFGSRSQVVDLCFDARKIRNLDRLLEALLVETPEEPFVDVDSVRLDRCLDFFFYLCSS